MSTSIEKLTSLGQSLWLDNIQRRQLENGELKAMIERGDIRGILRIRRFSIMRFKINRL